MDPRSNPSLGLPTLAALRRAWPVDIPFVGFGGTAGLTVVATSFREVEPETLLDRPLPPLRPAADPSFSSGWMGLLSYDHYRYGASGGAPLRVFRVDRALVIDRDADRWTHAGRGTDGATVDLADRDVELLMGRARELPPARPKTAGLLPTITDAAYEALVRTALDDIADGRYYQINLLRYFGFAQQPDVESLAARLDRFGGPFAAWVDVPGLSLVSFSPERFVRIRDLGGAPVLETFPIKGTAPRASDPALDTSNRDRLAASLKDRAELAMIVDLMRNDLSRVAVRGTVRVDEARRVLSVPTVHHLEASVSATPRPGLAVGELFRALCPGGSVTGAPKVEVMQAIRAYEGRERGYFMGHAFYLGDDGRLDSSILIRTAVRLAGKPYEFAAGSGIVTRSEPAAERVEIDVKTGVVAAPL